MDWKEEAIRLAKEGVSGGEIARRLGKGKTTVNDMLRKHFKGGRRVLKSEEVSKATPTGENAPKVLVLDIETKYLVLNGWQLFNQNFGLEQIEEDWSILSFSAKWYDSDEVMYHDVSEMSEFDLLLKLHELLNEAHFVIAHNGRRFDLKKIRARMIAEGFKPYSPVRIIDTFEIAKKEFGFSSNKLQYLTTLLCKTHVKSSHAKFAGFLLWKEFVKGNPEAIREMREYNQIDVLSLQELYDILSPWSSTLPVFEVYDDNPTDMSDWVKDGYVYSNLGKYHQYRNVKTGQYRRGRVNLLSKEKRKSLLANIV